MLSYNILGIVTQRENRHPPPQKRCRPKKSEYFFLPQNKRRPYDRECSQDSESALRFFYNPWFRINGQKTNQTLPNLTKIASLTYLTFLI